MSEHTPKQEATRSHGEHAHHPEAQAHHERVDKRREQAASHAEKTTTSHEELRNKVETQAVSGAEYHKPLSEKRQQANPTSKVDKERGFDTIMHQAQNEMSKPERAFSQFIHRPGVEKTSEVIGKTVARPSGVIGAALAAGIGLLFVYGIAKSVGFGLSGSEVPILLCIGFATGLFVEWCVKSLRAILGKTSKNS